MKMRIIADTLHTSARCREDDRVETHSSRILKRMRRLKLKMFAMPSAKPSIMQSTPVLC
jgi:hypothetical protein